MRAMFHAFGFPLLLVAIVSQWWPLAFVISFLYFVGSAEVRKP